MSHSGNLRNLEFNENNLTKIVIPQQLDVQSRANLVQDVIDRITDKNFGKEYLHDLAVLHQKLNIEYCVVNGVRKYGKSKDLQVTHNSNDLEEKDLSPIMKYDVQNKAQIIQDVIDRLIDRKCFAPYLKELEKLNLTYSVIYQDKNGIRIYKAKPASETPSICGIKTDIYIALADGVNEISNFDIKSDKHQNKAEFKKQKVSVLASDLSKPPFWKTFVNPVWEVLYSTSIISKIVYQSMSHDAKVYHHEKINKLQNFYLLKNPIQAIKILINFH